MTFCRIVLELTYIQLLSMSPQSDPCHIENLLILIEFHADHFRQVCPIQSSKYFLTFQCQNLNITSFQMQKLKMLIN